MKRKYEHRPGLFGLASIVAGYAGKIGEARTERNSPVKDNKRKIERRPAGEKQNLQSVKCSGGGAGQRHKT
jgi:hypothetical protein